eukprot:scaffold10784_cov52-Cylindrotheca_fusiformis.AAC.1
MDGSLDRGLMGVPSHRKSGTLKRTSMVTTTWSALKTIEDNDALDDNSSGDDIEATIPLVASMRPGIYKPWNHHSKAEHYVRQLSPNVLSSWGVLYCGGKTPLEKALHDAAAKARIAMYSESFSW